VRVDDLDAYAATTDRRDHLAQRLGGAAPTTDHRAEVLRVHPDLETLAAARVDHPDTYVLRVVDDSLDQVLQRGPEGPVSPARRRRHRPAPRWSRWPGPPSGPRQPPQAWPSSRPSAPSRASPPSPASPPSSPSWRQPARRGQQRPWPPARTPRSGRAAAARPSAARARAGP